MIEPPECVELDHSPLDDFSKGNPEPVKSVFCRRDDVTLANPFGPAVRRWNQVSGVLEFPASCFRDGSARSLETLAKYATPDLATILEVEEWQA